MQKTRVDKRAHRHRRLRHKIAGTAERPRLSVHKSLKHFYAQLIDDASGTTLASATTNLKSVTTSCRNSEGAKAVGKAIAEKAKEKGIETVVFDRGGNLYHGCLKDLADAARENGLKF